MRSVKRINLCRVALNYNKTSGKEINICLPGDQPQTSSKAMLGDDGEWTIFNFKCNLVQQKYSFSLLINMIHTSHEKNTDYIQNETAIIFFGKNKLNIV